MINEETIQAVWDKATIVENYDPQMFRKDGCGAWIIRGYYGQQESIYGWEIDHVYPQSLGGDDDIENLRAMQWENNRSKGDDYPVYKAVVKAEGNKNIRVDTQYTVNLDRQKILSEKYSIK